ncbi:MULTISPECIES: hypothetical protein [unclassified Vibrio]
MTFPPLRHMPANFIALAELITSLLLLRDLQDQGSVTHRLVTRGAKYD